MFSEFFVSVEPFVDCLSGGVEFLGGFGDGFCFVEDLLDVGYFEHEILAAAVMHCLVEREEVLFLLGEGGKCKLFCCNASNAILCCLYTIERS